MLAPRHKFLPDKGRLYALKLPVKVASNAKTRTIVCRGEGSELRLSFAPALVDDVVLSATLIIETNPFKRLFDVNDVANTYFRCVDDI